MKQCTHIRSTLWQQALVHFKAQPYQQFIPSIGLLQHHLLFFLHDCAGELFTERVIKEMDVKKKRKKKREEKEDAEKDDSRNQDNDNTSDRDENEKGSSVQESH